MKRTKKSKSKVCRTCGKRKSIKTAEGTNFWANSNSPDGLRDECKGCFYEWRTRARKAAANG